MYLRLFFLWEGRHWSFFIGNDGGEIWKGLVCHLTQEQAASLSAKLPTTPVTVSGWPRGRRDRTVVSLMRLEQVSSEVGGGIPSAAGRS